MTNRNKRAGSDYERQLRLEYRELGFKECETSRYASKQKDDQGIDLVNTGPLNVQAKWTKDIPNLEKVFAQMEVDTNYNIVHYKKNVGKGKPKQEYVFMKKADWYDMLQLMIKEGIVNV